MKNYIKPPTLSTNFSESGKSAKKRFDNILNINTKKTGIIAFTFILVLIGIVGTMVACDTATNENEYTLEVTKLNELAQIPIGSDMATLDYASDNKVIFHYGYALIVYDLQSEAIHSAIDLSKLNVPINTQGSTIIDIQASENGNKVFIGYNGVEDNNYEKYIYNIEKNTVKETKNLKKYEKFKGLSLMEMKDQDGWNSFNCVQLSETKRCYLLLTDSHYIADIKIVVEDGESKKEYNVFTNNTKELAIVIRDLINTICSSPLESSDPKDYIKEHQKEFNELIDMDINALSYMFKEFEKNDGTDILRENIMMLACRQILDAEDIKYTAARGVHWYDTMKDYIINQVYLNGYDFVKAHNPKAYIILDINGSLVTESQPNANYAQVMKYLGKDLIETYSPHYIIVDQFPASYEEKISNDDFEATFFYKMIFKNYYKDPDTVGYIKEAKEKDSKSYQTLYDEYNMEKECNYDLRVTTKILPDKSLDMDTFKLYHNMSPKGIEWQEIEGFSEFIIGNDEK